MSNLEQIVSRNLKKKPLIHENVFISLLLQQLLLET